MARSRVILVASALAACQGAGGSDATGSAGAEPHAATLASLEAGGLAVGRFVPEPSTTCMRGPVEGLEALLCPADEAAELNAKRFLSGAISGAIRTASGWVLAVADRDNSDPQGKRLDRILKTFDPKPVR